MLIIVADLIDSPCMPTTSTWVSVIKNASQTLPPILKFLLYLYQIIKILRLTCHTSITLINTIKYN